MPSSQIAVFQKLVAVVTAASLFTSCSGGPSFDTLFDPSPEAEGTGIVGAGLVRAVVIIAKYKATERQRRIAEENGRRAYTRMVSEREPAPQKKTASSKPHKVAAEKPAARKTAAKPKKAASPAVNERIADTQPRPEPEPEGTPKKQAVRKKSAPRYIAVDTEADARSKGAKSVMIWDTQSQQIVGNDVYDVQAVPRVGTIARFETYSAKYVGSGADY